MPFCFFLNIFCNLLLSPSPDYFRFMNQWSFVFYHWLRWLSICHFVSFKITIIIIICFNYIWWIGIIFFKQCFFFLLNLNFLYIVLFWDFLICHCSSCLLGHEPLCWLLFFVLLYDYVICNNFGFFSVLFHVSLPFDIKRKSKIRYSVK